MDTRSGNHIPFLEEEKKEKVSRPPQHDTEHDTRSANLIPLLNIPYLEEHKGVRFPTKSDVFAHFLYLHTFKKMKLSLAKRAAVTAAADVWEKVAVTPKTMKNGIMMLSGIFDEYQAIQHHVHLQYA